MRDSESVDCVFVIFLIVLWVKQQVSSALLRLLITVSDQQLPC